MKCPDCYWEGNDYLKFFHLCSMHDDLDTVHFNDEDTNLTLCGLGGFNVTEEIDDVTPGLPVRSTEPLCPSGVI